ncbi:MAG: hypothetical protein V3W34_07835 [Phycisphaerae bacterium]
MKTIQATVNVRLLGKASRLFTGTLEGRIIEILQNARRAGATEVHISNTDGVVSVRDNGGGIDDFAELLDLGGSGWDEAFEASEDPAGVGIFCLAPREVMVRSNGRMVTITEKGWTGEPVSVLDDSDPVQGTVLYFADEPWSSSAVDINAVFCGMQVTVDGHSCPKLPFISEEAVTYPDLGCRIEVRKEHDLSPWHHSVKRSRWYGNNVLVNFHGQMVCFDHHPVSEHRLHYLVDMTGEPTGIRLMLPARTCLVENEAFGALKAALELEAYRFIQRRGEHELPHKEYLRAIELGINLPEAKPTYTVGLLTTHDAPEPVEVVMPKDFPLDKCYRFDTECEEGGESDEANVHLLAALGKFEPPFVPVWIRSGYDGYSWAKLPTIEKVEVSIGKTLHQDWLWSGTLTCVDELRIAVHTSDGKVFESPVCMAINPEKAEKQSSEDCVLVTPEAEERLSPSEIWYHFGGWSDDGDTYDTQAAQFEEDLDRFWSNVVGPDEHLRRNILRTLQGIQPKWQRVTISPDGVVVVRYADGSDKTLQPPQPRIRPASAE